MSLDDLSVLALILSGLALLLVVSGVALDIYDLWLDRTTGKWLREQAERDAARRRHPTYAGRQMVDDLWAAESHQWDDEGEALPDGDAA